MRWETFVGLPWRDRGRGDGGYDCWGLLIAAFRAGTGIELPSHADSYRTAADREEAAAVFAGEVGDWRSVPPRDAREFDVAVMRITGRLHVGLIVRRGLMLHMPVGQTSVIEPTQRFVRVLDGFYRHKGIA